MACTMTTNSLGFFPLNTHFLTPLTVAVIVGISLQAMFAIPLWVTFCVVSAALIMLCYVATTQRYTNKIKVLLFTLCTALGIALYQYQLYKQELFNRATHQQTFSVVGSVEDIQPSNNKRYNTLITLNITQLKKSNAPSYAPWQNTNKVIHLYTHNTQSLPGYGDTILLQNLLFKRPRSGSFALYLLRERIAATLFVDKLDSITLQHNSANIYYKLGKLKRNLFSSLRQKIAPPVFALFSSLFLGNKQDMHLINNLKEQFHLWGLSHYLARSGLHLVIFVMLWQLLLSFCPLPRITKDVILLIISTAYVLLSWPSVSFTRAFILFVLYKLCNISTRSINTVHLITLTCLLMLITNPVQLLFLDFQLSFAFTFALAWFSKAQKQGSYTLTKQTVAK